MGFLSRLSILALAASLALSACGGGSSGGSSGSVLPAAVRSSERAPAPAAKRGEARVVMHVRWKSRHSMRPHVGSHYLPATARSLSITINGSVTQYTNAPATIVAFDAPVGHDTFYVQSYDESNGMGNVLSRGYVTQQISSTAKNTIAITLNGVVASLTLGLTNTSPKAGASASITVNVAALDSDGNVIVGPGDYSVPIRLSVNDSTKSNTLKLSTSLLQNPGIAVKLAYNGGTLNSGLPGGPTATVIASATGVSTIYVALTPTPAVYEFPVLANSHKPQWIAAGSDGNLWFTETPGNTIVRMKPTGGLTDFPIPTANAGPAMIISGSDGNLWFTESGSTANKIAKSTTAGAMTEYSTLFAPPPPDEPYGLVDRGDGTIWYVASGSSRVGYQSATGLAGETSIPTSASSPFGIATAPDNNLYYTEGATDKIGRITSLFTAQSEISLTAGTQPQAIVRGPDGNLWFTEYGRGNIGRLSPLSFSVTGEFPTLTPNSFPLGIAVGQDGALWFTEYGQNKIGRITTGGTVSEYAVPGTNSGLRGITAAANGYIWFTESNSGRIGKLVY